MECVAYGGNLNRPIFARYVGRAMVPMSV